MISDYSLHDGLIWFDGGVIPWCEAKVHILSQAMNYACSVFEGVRLYNGRAFKLVEHIERLQNSANILNLRMPFSTQVLSEATTDIILQNNLSNAYVRMLAWKGSEEMDIHSPNTSTHIAIAAWDWPKLHSEQALLKGIKLKTSPWRRPNPQTAPTNAKASGLYMISSLSKTFAIENQFDDALLLDYRGYVAESSAANLFFIKNNKLFTPVPDCFLNGITRQTIIDIAQKNHIEVIEDFFSYDTLLLADEVFLTGTAYEVIPVQVVDSNWYKVGPMTRFLQEQYFGLVGKRKIMNSRSGDK